VKRIILLVLAAAFMMCFVLACESKTHVSSHTQITTESEYREVP